GYEGHYFWDTETFIMPFFTLTNPDLSKMLLRYRYSTLNKAKENALLLGHSKGALFPWRTITGTECSGYFVSGSAAYHINADIAYAFINYYITTGDLDFMREAGMEVLLETSRLWMDLGCYNQKGNFVLNVVTGPDEYTCMVNNNYYTNAAAKYNLNWAVKLHEILKEAGFASELDKKLNITEEELKSFKKAASKMLLLYDSKLGINPQDDSFLNKPLWDLENTPKENFPLLLHYHPLHLYRYQVCKQADTVLSYFMFENEQPRDVMKRSFEYYEKITTHDSSLSTCVFSIVASRLGMKEKAYSYFGDSAKLDLMNTHNNTKHGIHTANMGGCYMAIVNGFAGLRVSEEGISIEPSLPKTWNGFRFKFVYKKKLIKVTIDKENVTVELLSGKEQKIKIFSKEYTLTEGEKTSVKMED
ncbi:MAG: glycoside hydrolase family 65 protein, partial [Lachnospiraceae bacterium]|nr:glycoside hydrolase family 65 protein [Lachnospiraceae bacterium]